MSLLFSLGQQNEWSKSAILLPSGQKHGFQFRQDFSEAVFKTQVLLGTTVSIPTPRTVRPLAPGPKLARWMTEGTRPLVFKKFSLHTKNTDDDPLSEQETVATARIVF